LFISPPLWKRILSFAISAMMGFIPVLL